MHESWREIIRASFDKLTAGMTERMDPRAAPRAMQRIALAAALLAMLFGAWLRLHGLSIQVVQDDEWHAIHKLLDSDYAGILRTFGFADHSIPLTLLYKAMASTIGLDEVDMRIVQVACGVATIGVAAWLAWRVTANAAVASLFAFLVAGAPFHVLYSRVARPYAITTLLVVVALAALWRWKARRAWTLAAAICALAALAAWLHPLSALFPMAGVLFVMVGDIGAAGPERARALRSSTLLAIAAIVSIVAPLAAPLLNDFGSLSAKAGNSLPDLSTLFRMASLFAGGLPDLLTLVVLLVAAYGAWRFWQTHGDLGPYLVFVALAPIMVVMALRGAWAHQGHTFARYVFPVQLVLLFWFSVGAIDCAKRLIARMAPLAELGVAAALISAYLWLNPAIVHVLTLGPWSGHLYHNFDYVLAHNRAALYYNGATPPHFYGKLGAMPPGTVPIVEAPFSFMAPWNPLAFYAQFHRQPESLGMLHDLCLAGPRFGEPPRDPRFRFRSFIFLDDRAAVLATGAHYLLLHRQYLNGLRFESSDRCLAALKRIYGEPVEIDERLAVFDLRRLDAPRKLQ